LKPEWWGSPLAQEEKYQGRKPVTRNDDDDDDNNNNNNKLRLEACVVGFTTGSREVPGKKENL
jgi:hypothetical protein